MLTTFGDILKKARYVREVPLSVPPRQRFCHPAFEPGLPEQGFLVKLAVDTGDNMYTISDNMSPKGIAETLFPKTRLAVLGELVRIGAEGVYLRELERWTGLNKRGLLRELHAMRDAGILTAKRVGRQVFYRLNSSCPISDELRSIVLKTVGLGDVLREALSPFAERIDLAYFYGSLASGEASAGSDVDVMVVGAVTLRELSTPLREAGALLRREINPTLYQPDEYREALRTENTFVSRVHRGPRIDLIGGAA